MTSMSLQIHSARVGYLRYLSYQAGVVYHVIYHDYTKPVVTEGYPFPRLHFFGLFL